MININVTIIMINNGNNIIVVIILVILVIVVVVGVAINRNNGYNNGNNIFKVLGMALKVLTPHIICISWLNITTLSQPRKLPASAYPHPLANSHPLQSPPPGDRRFHVFLVNMYCACLCCPSALRMALHCFPITSNQAPVCVL